MENIIEFNGKEYRDFHSMREFVNAIARTTKVMSWGARNWTKMEKGKLLRFRVNAHRHKGYIFVAVNGADLFDIFLTNLQGKIKKVFTDVYLDDFIDVIDREIEYIPDYNY